MTNPYEILGLTPSATEEEVTRAYRKLAKKYHPDLNPGDKSAEQKMREINAAYEQIQNGEAGEADAGPQGGYGNGQQAGYGSAYSEEGPFGFGFEDFFNFGRQQRTQQRQFHGSPRMSRVSSLINNHQFREAWHILSEMHDRDGEWYFFSAIINDGLGNRASALGDAREAVRRDPGNAEYSALLQQFEAGAFNYRQTGQGYGYDMNSFRNVIIPLFLAPLVCMCCCRH